MKNFKISAILFLLLIGVFSCQKHAITYNTEKVDKDQAEFQLHYVVPVTASSDNNIYRVEINDQLYANKKAPLNTYNAVPSGAVGRFYATPAGETNIKLYKGEDEVLVYDQNCELKPGKQNIFVYDFDEPPVIIDNDYPYERLVSDSTGKTAWVKFYNFLFESENTPTPLTIQYQYQYVNNENDTKDTSDWISLGEPVAFGESTDWVPVPVYKTVERSSGYAKIDYRIFEVNADGSLGDTLKVLNSSGNMVNYSDWWNAYVGRRYHHILSGMRVEKPVSAVRQFTAL